MRRYTVVGLGLLVGLAVAWAGGDAATAPATQPVEKGAEAQTRKLIESFAGGHLNNAARVAYGKIVGIGKAAIPALAAALKDPRKNVRWFSVEALGAIGGKDAVGPLISALSDKDKDVRRYAAAFLGRCGKESKKAAAALGKALRDENPEVVWHAMEALDALGEQGYKKDGALVAALRPQLNNPNMEIVAHAARALGVLGSPKACGPLVKVMTDPASTRYKGVISRALIKIGSRDAVPFLLKAIKNPRADKNSCFMAGETLWHFADPRANKDLLALAESPQAHLRGTAAKALGFPRNAPAVAKLANIATDSEEEKHVRENAIRSLGRIGDPKAVDALSKALFAKPERIRRAAAFSLGSIRSPQAVPALIKALEDDSTYVPMYAAQALGGIGDKRAAIPIVRLFDRKGALDMVAANPWFANLATVAHHALVEITKMNIAPKDWGIIGMPNQLEHVRKAWRIKLGLEKAAMADAKKPATQLAVFDLDKAARMLTKAVGGKWEKGPHNAFLRSMHILRGRIYSKARKVGVSYDIFPFAANSKNRKQVLKIYAKNNVNLDLVRVLGVNSQCIVLASSRDHVATAQWSEGVIDVLKLSPPKITLRSEALKANLDRFMLYLQYYCSKDKDYHSLILHTADVEWNRAPNDLLARISKRQAEKIIDYLTAEGFLANMVNSALRSVRVLMSPSYNLLVMGKEVKGLQFREELGWGPGMLKRLDGLRKVLDGKAAKGMDKLLKRLEPQRKNWANPTTQPGDLRKP